MRAKKPNAMKPVILWGIISRKTGILRDEDLQETKEAAEYVNDGDPLYRVARVEIREVKRP